MKKLTPMRAIRAKCLDCSSESFAEVKNCPIPTCPLYPYKSGHKPKEGTQEYNFITQSTLKENTALSPTVNEKEKLSQQPTKAMQEQPQHISERIS